MTDLRRQAAAGRSAVISVEAYTSSQARPGHDQTTDKPSGVPAQQPQGNRRRTRRKRDGPPRPDVTVTGNNNDDSTDSSMQDVTNTERPRLRRKKKARSKKTKQNGGSGGGTECLRVESASSFVDVCRALPAVDDDPPGVMDDRDIPQVDSDNSDPPEVNSDVAEVGGGVSSCGGSSSRVEARVMEPAEDYSDECWTLGSRRSASAALQASDDSIYRKYRYIVSYVNILYCIV